MESTENSNTTKADPKWLVPELLRYNLSVLDREIEALKKKRKDIIQEVTDKCDHPLESIVELPYEEVSLLNTRRPWLVCSKCGYAEEGWGTGYKKLRKAEHQNPVKITHEEFCALVTLTVSQPRATDED